MCSLAYTHALNPSLEGFGLHTPVYGLGPPWICSDFLRDGRGVECMSSSQLQCQYQNAILYLLIVFNQDSLLHVLFQLMGPPLTQLF